MTRIRQKSISNEPEAATLLKKGLHGGFLDKESLRQEEVDFCNKVEWIESAVNFNCPSCGNSHTTKPREEKCLRTQAPINISDPDAGYRVIAESKIQLEDSLDYSLYVEESTSTVDSSKLPHKSIVFLPQIDEDEVIFSDKAGSTVFLSLEQLPAFAEESERSEIVDKIDEKRRKLVDWSEIEDGDEFEELLFRLITRDEDYFNESWGGVSFDQGKDGFCSIDLGGRETRVLIQAKFNNNGDAVSAADAGTYCRKAARHDCGGLLIGCVKSSGDLESEIESGALHSKDVYFPDIWSSPILKEKLAEHPDLISEFFLN